MRIVRSGHSVIFYRRRPDLADAIYFHICPALERASKVVLIATASHQTAIEARLRSADFDPHILRDAGIFLMLNAEATLEKFTRAGAFDEPRFQALIGSQMPPRDITHAYGEMVNVLVEREKYDEALELERMWNRLAAKHSFNLLCAYHTGAFDTRVPANFLCRACKEHDQSSSLSADAEAPAIKNALRELLGSEAVADIWPRAIASDTRMPPTFAALHWLRENLPHIAENIAATAPLHHHPEALA